jgi:hypothetical protein
LHRCGKWPVYGLLVKNADSPHLCWFATG